jgi:hypothetical protein
VQIIKILTTSAWYQYAGYASVASSKTTVTCGQISGKLLTTSRKFYQVENFYQTEAIPFTHPLAILFPLGLLL